MFSWFFPDLVELIFFSSFWCFIQVYHVLFKFYSSLCLIKDSIFIYKLWSKSAYNYAKVHTSRINYIQVGLSAYIRNVTCRTAYMRKRSKNYPIPCPILMTMCYASLVRALATYLIIHIFVQSWTELNWNAEVDKIVYTI